MFNIVRFNHILAKEIGGKKIAKFSHSKLRRKTIPELPTCSLAA